VRLQGDLACHAVNGSAGEVTLQTHLAGDRVRITIVDRGVGIEPRDVGHIFDPYFTTKRAGTGLGLPIAKNIVEGLGGTITVSSVPGRGTEMRIELPLAFGADPHAAHASGGQTARPLHAQPS